MPARGLSTDRHGGDGDRGQASADHVAMARALLLQSELRRGMFPSLLRQPAWDMLLAAYVALHESVELTPVALCACSGEPIATARRWLRMMEEEGLVRRSDADSVVITECAALRLQRLLNDLVSQSSDPPQPA
jgi:hypothetical protein